MNAYLRPRSVPVSRNRAAGFTLIEIILATVLLALGMAIAFASLHSANGSVQRAELAAGRNEHLRAVQSLLYRFLQSAQPLVLARDDMTQQVTYLDGAHDKLRFVAPMPGYLSRGGPYVVTLKLAPSDKGDGTQKLQFAYAMLVNEKPLADDDKLPPEDLLDGIADAHFEYRGLGQDAKIGDWKTEWKRSAELPVEVRLVLRFADAGRPWPAFSTALPLGFASAHAENAMPGSQPPQQQVPPPTTGGGK
jgi:general secretion pathway protein J